ncbi:VOC family protein [Labrys sp. ZIDIC5]|uniref:VOC family protein n=1 Tax=Labrys sedimenti TaxID=3106036 RepID=UPI002ACA7E71|nr:VOC family protein [Labrys sp. ZIDIC5]MDZ5448681.1 VOC family protein [Labrys sp. ZIDIC5]
MIDHFGFPVRDYRRSRAFYDQVLAPLGYSVQKEVTREMTGNTAQCGYGTDGRPQFWLGDGDTREGSFHIAFAAKNRKAVDAFYAAALAAGARDNGPPGIRAHYHPNYYAAFVLDPDGHNIEAVCHLPG